MNNLSITKSINTMEHISELCQRMVDVHKALDGNKHFNFAAEISSYGDISVRLYTKDFKDAVVYKHFKLEEIADAIALINRIEGYAVGFGLGYDTAKMQAAPDTEKPLAFDESASTEE